MAEIQERIMRFQEFFDLHYKAKIHEAVAAGLRSLIIDFGDLVKFDHEIADHLLTHPEDALKELSMSIEQFDLQQVTPIHVRLDNLPQSQKIKIRDIRSEHISRLIAFEGIVRQASDVRPQVVSAKFECPSCGNLITIPQVEQRFREPFRCSCGKRGKFKIVSRELVDTQRLVVEESPEALEGGEQPKRLSVFLREDLVEPKMEKRTTPGAKILISAVIKEIAIQFKSGAQSTRYDLVAEANNIKPIEETYEEIEITKEDEIKIKQLAKDPKAYEKLINSMGISIYGHESIKGSLVLQLMGGVKKERSDGTATKGDIHILLVGDPGSAKTSLLLFMSKVAPKCRYVAGKGASGVGLTASIVKDEFLRGWALEAGAIVLANGGFLCLHPDTSVILDHRIANVKELFREQECYTATVKDKIVEVNDSAYSVPSFNLENNSVDTTIATKIGRKYYKGKVLSLTLDSGFCLRLTPDHQLLSGKDLEWLEASRLQVNDSIVAPLKLPSKNNEVYIFDVVPAHWKISLNYKEKIRLRSSISKKYRSLAQFNRAFNIDRHYLSGGKQFSVRTFKDIVSALGELDYWRNKPLCYTRKSKGERLKTARITPELAYVIGFILGDGHSAISNRRSSFFIRQALVHQHYVNRLTMCWKTVFRRLPKYYVEAGRNVLIKGKSALGGKSYNIFYGSNLLGLLYGLFTGNNLADVFMLNDEVAKGFVAGCMDTDGYAGTKRNFFKRNKTYRVHHAEFDLGLSREENLNFILLLRRFDCHARLIKPRRMYAVSITGRNDIIALKTALDAYSVKTKRLKISPKLKKISAQSDILPAKPVARIARRIAELNTSLLAREGVWSTIYRYKTETMRPSREQLLKIKDILGDSLNQPLQAEITRLCRRDYYLEKIKGIKEEHYEGYVYDLYVPTTHNFVAGGVFVHNCLDEMDKMAEEDTSALHEALAQQRVTISKANIQATLKAQTTVLAAANPKYGRFDPYQPIAAQIELPPTLINRFDLIFPVRDLPSKDKDTKIASHILELQRQTEEKQPEVPLSLIKKYVAYARKNVFPKLTDDSIEELKEFYVSLRNMPTVGEEGGVKPIPISARQLEALVRLSEASARIRLSDKVTRNDARNAINILKHCLMQVGFDYETGQIDIDRISTGIPASTRSKIIIIREIIHEFDAKGKKSIPIEDIIAEASEKNLREDHVEEVLEKLKREGEIFEPRRGFISKV